MVEYSVIYDKFEKIITDFDLQDLVPSNKEEFELDYLQKAIARMGNRLEDLSQRDDALGHFDNDISETTQTSLAYYMAQSWTEPYVNNQDLFELNFATQEFNAFSSANKITALLKCADYCKRQAGKISGQKSVFDVMGRLK